MPSVGSAMELVEILYIYMEPLRVVSWFARLDLQPG